VPPVNGTAPDTQVGVFGFRDNAVIHLRNDEILYSNTVRLRYQDFVVNTTFNVSDVCDRDIIVTLPPQTTRSITMPLTTCAAMTVTIFTTTGTKCPPEEGIRVDSLFATTDTGAIEQWASAFTSITGNSATEIIAGDERFAQTREEIKQSAATFLADHSVSVANLRTGQTRLNDSFGLIEQALRPDIDSIADTSELGQNVNDLNGVIQGIRDDLKSFSNSTNTSGITIRDHLNRTLGLVDEHDATIAKTGKLLGDTVKILAGVRAKLAQVDALLKQVIENPEDCSAWEILTFETKCNLWIGMLLWFAMVMLLIGIALLIYQIVRKAKKQKQSDELEHELKRAAASGRFGDFVVSQHEGTTIRHEGFEYKLAILRRPIYDDEEEQNVGSRRKTARHSGTEYSSLLH